MRKVASQRSSTTHPRIGGVAARANAIAPPLWAIAFTHLLPAANTGVFPPPLWGRVREGGASNNDRSEAVWHDREASHRRTAKQIQPPKALPTSTGYWIHTSRSVRCLRVPSPLVGKGQGGGYPSQAEHAFWPFIASRSCRLIQRRARLPCTWFIAPATTPLPNPPPQGGREHACIWRTSSPPTRRRCVNTRALTRGPKQRSDKIRRCPMPQRPTARLGALR
jgi:hypothetical protein